MRTKLVIGVTACCFLAILSAVSVEAQSLPELTAEQRRILSTHVLTDQILTDRRFSRAASSETPRVLPITPFPDGFTFSIEGHAQTIDEYMRRHPVTALLIAHDGNLIFERYQHGAGAASFFLSNSIAKSLVGLSVLHAIAEGVVDLDDRIDRHIPALATSPVGATTIRDNLRMGTGLSFVENYSGNDDLERFGRSVRSSGVATALREITGMPAVPHGTRFAYAGFSTAALALATEGAVRRPLAAYFADRVWRRIGSEAPISFRIDPRGAALGYCCTYARARDYLRLGMALAEGGPASPPRFLDQTARVDLLDRPFRPSQSRLGYANQFWVSAGRRATLYMLGVRGQHVMIDPARRLVFVQFSVSERVLASETGLLRDRNALWAALQTRFERR